MTPKILSGDDLKKLIGATIRKTREALNLSREELSTKSITTSHNLYRIETGKTSPSLETARNIRNVLGLSIDEMVDGYTTQENQKEA